MELEEYRKNNNLSYRGLSNYLGFSINKTFRICKNEECVKLRDADKIVKKTGGVISYVDLLPEDC